MGPFGRADRDFWLLTDGNRAPRVLSRTKWMPSSTGNGDREIGSSMSHNMTVFTVIAVAALLLLLTASIRVVQQYQRGVHFRLGRVIAVREPGLRLIIPVIDRLWRVSMRIVTMPIQSQGIITRDNVSVDIAAVAYFRVIDARKSVVVIENVGAAIDQIAQTTLRNVVGQHSLDEVLAQTEKITPASARSWTPPPWNGAWR